MNWCPNRWNACDVVCSPLASHGWAVLNDVQKLRGGRGNLLVAFIKLGYYAQRSGARMCDRPTPHPARSNYIRMFLMRD
jgi:hypothetical protein